MPIIPIQVILLIAVPIAGLALILRMLETSAKAKDGFLTGKITPTERIQALVLALFFGASAYFLRGSGFFGAIFTLLLVLITLAFIAYALGFNGLLKLLQYRKDNR